MDPDENLKEQLELSKKIDGDNGWGLDDARRLAELVLALDGWMKEDGFLPSRWKTSHHP